MKKILFYLVVLLSWGSLLFAQESLSDLMTNGERSMRQAEYGQASNIYAKALKLAQETGSNLGQAKAANKLGNAWWYLRDYNKALTFYELALEKYEEIGNDPEIINSLNNLGTVNNDLGLYSKSLEYFLKALTLCRRLDNNKLLAFVLNNVGNTYLRWGNFDKSLSYYLQSLRLRQENNDLADIAASYNNIALVYKELGDFSKAVQFQQKAIDHITVDGDKELLGDSFNYMGNIYLKWKQYGRALEYYRKSLELRREIVSMANIAKSLNNIGLLYMEEGDLEKAIDEFNSSLKIRQEIGDRQGVAISYTQIGMACSKMDKSADAINAFEQSLQIRREIGDNSGIVENLILLGRELAHQKRFSSALAHLGQAQTLARELSVKTWLIDCYQAVSDVQQLQDKPTLALASFKRWAALKDSVYSASNALRIAELQSMYEIEQKEIKIDAQRLELKRQKAFTYFYLSIAVFMIVLASLLLKLYSIKRRSNEELTGKNQKIEQQNKDLERINHELSYANASKDRLFSIISHDLMNPFQILIGSTELMAINFDNFSKEDLKSFIDDIHLSSVQTFSLVENLLTWARNQTGGIKYSPERIDAASLVTNNIDLVRNMADKKSIKLVENLPGELDVFADWNMLATVIRNLTTNAIKFTRADGQIEIGYTPAKDEVNFYIRDNGVGMSQKQIDELFILEHNSSRRGTANEGGTGLGLILCKDFIERNGGNIRVESQVNKGSAFIFSIPRWQGQ